MERVELRFHQHLTSTETVQLPWTIDVKTEKVDESRANIGAIKYVWTSPSRKRPIISPK